MPSRQTGYQFTSYQLAAAAKLYTFGTDQQRVFGVLIETILFREGYRKAVYTFRKGRGFELVTKGFEVTVPHLFNDESTVRVTYAENSSRKIADRHRASIVAALQTVIGPIHARQLVRVVQRKVSRSGDAPYFDVTVLVPAHKALQALYRELGPRF